MPNAYIGFGSNIGDRLSYIHQTLECLSAEESTSIVQVSSIYETEPVSNDEIGDDEQDWFLNGVVRVETDVLPQKLLATLQAIERKIGRKQRGRWGPRETDLDILIYDRFCVSTPRLTIPHPEMHQRRFVLEPFAEIAPDVIHPIFQERIDTLIRRVTAWSIVRVFSPPPTIGTKC
ncbi:MAG: 2-amino-4-hydroxy-6-hydroxymethyldihydropteridine diphosphokinase [Candidatus Poribacteria bacterium]|nr:2-amino-4-hydroxy-6-hydroxymethyldihydropteridine diphosphokinase [Candidatus Poribacteria bacterium]